MQYNSHRSGPGLCYSEAMVARALPRSHPKSAFHGVKVFSATMFADRGRLGDRVTQWLSEHPEVGIVELKVTQSSDAAFHCITISVFYVDRNAARAES